MSGAPVPARWLSRNVAAIALLSLFSDMSHEMVTAVLPLYVALIGGTAAAVGLVDGLSDFAASLAKLGISWTSDRVGRRKPVLILGYTLTGIMGLMGFATSVAAVTAIRAFAWLGRGARGPVRDALLAESVAPAYASRAFGLHRSADTVGAILGPAIAFGLLALAVPLRSIFYVSLIPGAITILIVVFVLRDRAQTPGHGRSFGDSLRALPSGYRRFLLAVGIFGLGNFGHTLLILRAQELLTPRLGAAQASTAAIGLYILFNVFYAAGAYPAGLWSERIGKRAVLAIGYLVFALMCLGFLCVGDAGVFTLAVLFALGGGYIALVDTMEGALAAELLPASALGTGFGALGVVNGAGDLLSSVIVGLLWSRVSIASGFLYAIALTLAGGLLLLWTRPRRAAP